MEIVLASSNLHKIREFREMLRNLKHLDVLTLHSFSDYVPPEETADTFEGNAILKAEHAAKTLGKWVLADDSGLVVPALNGKPGVRSRRYAGEDATDAENNKKLLGEMEGLTELERAAYYECSLALASPEGLKKSVRGVCEGQIQTEARGSSGFGYDSVFAKHDYDKTLAELDEATKNRISHRYKAIEKLLPTLEVLKS